MMGQKVKKKRNKVSDKRCRFCRSKSIRIVSIKKGRVWIRNRKARIGVSGDHFVVDLYDFLMIISR